MSLLSHAMPLHAAIVGEWRGTYAEFDGDNRHIQTYDSHLVCELPDPASGYDLVQTNRYSFADGRVEVHSFPARLQLNRLVFDTDRIEGCAQELGDGLSVFVTWRRKDQPQLRYFEMVQFDEAITRKARVWQAFDDGRLVRRTLIEERRTK